MHTQYGITLSMSGCIINTLLKKQLSGKIDMIIVHIWIWFSDQFASWPVKFSNWS